MRPTPFLRTTALASGMTDSEIRRAVRAGELDRLEPGVYLHNDDSLDELDRYRVRVRSVGAALAPGTVISHESAAVLYGLALWKPDLTRVHVTRDRSGGGRRNASRHLHVAPLRPHDLSEVSGVPCTSLARTVVDLACTLDFDEAVIAGDCAAARDAQFDSALLCCLDESGPRRGIAVARRVVAFLDGRSESPGESPSRVRMHQAGMPAPTLRKEIRTPDGQFVARVDFLGRAKESSESSTGWASATKEASRPYGTRSDERTLCATSASKWLGGRGPNCSGSTSSALGSTVPSPVRGGNRYLLGHSLQQLR